MKNRFYTWLKDIPISRKLYLVVGVMALLIAVELFTLWFAITTLSSIRAFVGGEGLWSKAQKNAIYSLERFGRTRDQKDFTDFLSFMKVPQGDHKARVELRKPNPDLVIVRQGFLEGRNHPDDIDGMIKLIKRFHNISYINDAIVIWTTADAKSDQLMPIAERLQVEIMLGHNKTDGILKEIEPINEELTVLEDQFSYTLGKGSRWLESLILKILLSVALTVEVSGLALSVMLSRGIVKGIGSIVSTSETVANGNFLEKAKVYSKDEIGQLAVSFNNMIDQLQKKTNERLQAEDNLRKSNKELEQFAYVVSHDLREPLRTVTSYVQLLQARLTNRSDKEEQEFMNFAVDGASRMDQLINDLLIYSRINPSQKEFTSVDCSAIVATALASLDESIRKNKAEITVQPLPSVKSNEFQMTQLFQNLINNAIKFHGPERPKVDISVEKHKNGWLFSIQDNGIGIDKKYAEKIFIIFQRLHAMNTYEGTGIGLAICKKIVENHGGKIWFESEVGKGTAFYFTLNNMRTNGH